MRGQAWVVLIAVIGCAACTENTARGAMDALAQGELDRAREIYARGVNPDEQVKGQTALTMAACHAPPEVAELLLDAGADPDLPSRRRMTPLILASRCGNLRVVRLLLERGADPNLAGPGGETALSIAQEAGAEELVKLLLDAGADPEKAQIAGRRLVAGY